MDMSIEYQCHLFLSCIYLFIMVDNKIDFDWSIETARVMCRIRLGLT